MGTNIKECLNSMSDCDAVVFEKRKKGRNESFSVRETYLHLQELTKDEMSGICFKIPTKMKKNEH